MNSYEERKQKRIDRYRALSRRRKAESERRFKASHDAIAGIPLGQPILIGHHSENRHRAALRRSDDAMRASIEADKKAKYYEAKAAAVENNHAISSDDPEAIPKIEHRIKRMEEDRDTMKAINKLWRQAGKPQVESEDYPAFEERLEAAYGEKMKSTVRGNLIHGIYKVPFPPYSFQNLGGNLKRYKDRLARLKKAATQETRETTIGKVRIVDNVEQNRVQLFFPGKPSAEIRTKLKRHYGFRWSPSKMAWQRQRSNIAIYYAKEIAKEYSDQ
jgi:ABC-type transporter MlaC component